MKLVNGDCLELLKDLEPKSVDLVFCDLPYGQTTCAWDNKIDLSKLWKELKRVVKPTTPLFFTCSTKFGYELIKSNEKGFRYDLVCEKSSPRGFLCARKMPMKTHEMIYVFYDKLPLYDISSHKHKFVDDAPVRINARCEKTQISKQQISGIDTPYGSSNGGTIGNVHGTNYDPPLPTSVIQFKSERGKHKTQKPTSMMNWIFKYYSKDGDMILDPTMGSGSMGVACKEMNKELIGIEVDEEIYKFACERLIDCLQKD